MDAIKTTLTKTQLIAIYNKYYPKFEILPNSQNLKESLEYYKRKLREFEILATAFKKSDYEIPGFLLSNGVNCSQMIRNIEKRIKYL